DRTGHIAAAVIEPLVQGAAGMRLWPRGMLKELRAGGDAQGGLFVAGGGMTGVGGTGTMFAWGQGRGIPDLLCLAKGLSAGYLPIAATMATQRVFEAFQGEPGERRAFYYGHSYTANPLGCAVALENLRIFRDEHVLATIQMKIARLAELLRERL